MKDEILSSEVESGSLSSSSSRKVNFPDSPKKGDMSSITATETEKSGYSTLSEGKKEKEKTKEKDKNSPNKEEKYLDSEKMKLAKLRRRLRASFGGSTSKEKEQKASTPEATPSLHASTYNAQEE